MSHTALSSHRLASISHIAHVALGVFCAVLLAGMSAVASTRAEQTPSITFERDLPTIDVTQVHKAGVSVPHVAPYPAVNESAGLMPGHPSADTAVDAAAGTPAHAAGNHAAHKPGNTPDSLANNPAGEAAARNPAIATGDELLREVPAERVILASSLVGSEPTDGQDVARATPVISPTPVAVQPPVKSVRKVLMEVTAYCPCRICCGPRARGITASGKRVSYAGGRFVAADTRVLPFGTLISIPGYHGGMAVEVIDRGGAIKGNKLDVYFPSHKAAKKWGRQKLWVTVVEE